MESEWILPTGEITRDGICSGKCVCSCRHLHRPWCWSSSASKSPVLKPWTGIPPLAHLSDDVLLVLAGTGGACTALCPWDTATAPRPGPPWHQPGHGRWGQPRNTAARTHLRSSANTREAPARDTLSSWCLKAWGQYGGTLVWWASLQFSSFISKFSPSKILPKKPAIPNTGNTHMIFAADHILLNLSSSWHTQLMSLQRTIHPLPNGAWIQPSVPSTSLKIGHNLWKPNMVLKTQDVLMMPD